MQPTSFIKRSRPALTTVSIQTTQAFQKRPAGLQTSPHPPQRWTTVRSWQKLESTDNDKNQKELKGTVSTESSLKTKWLRTLIDDHFFKREGSKEPQP